MRIFLNGWLIFLLSLTPLPLTSAAELSPGSSDRLETVILDVRNMDCPMCKITIRKALEKVDGVRQAKVDYDTRTARVLFDPGLTNVDALAQATTNAGYPSTLRPE
jgi:mercuric ion binding protein